MDYSENGGSSYTTCYYLRNALGDIIKLIDGNKSTMVEYTYDSWGKILATTGSLATSLGEDQPFRYRGYVYDTETQLYYLQSRYYDPSTCRFISSDVYLSTGQGVIGHNSYAYCNNNPLNRVDSDGQISRPYNVGEVDTGDHGGGGFGIGIWKLIGGLVTPSAPVTVIPDVRPKVETEVETQSETKTETKEKNKGGAVYYGAVALQNQFQVITGPMDYWEAIIWAYVVAKAHEISINGQMVHMNREFPFGIYTKDSISAGIIVPAFGIPKGVEDYGPGTYRHWHIFGKFAGRYRHFHVWFGEPV